MRYIAIPIKADWEDDPPVHLHASMTVHEEDARPVFSGLLDANGDPLYRAPDKIKLGFDTQPRIGDRSMKKRKGGKRC